MNKWNDTKAAMAQYCEQNPNQLTKSQLTKIEAESQHPKKGTISDELLDFKLWCRGLPSRQESFARYIMALMPSDGKQKLLEVGGGRNGRLSLLLAERGYDMTCMDPQLELDHSAGIGVIKEPFDYRCVDLSGYDFVVAQEPCEATEHVVRACAKQRIPFVMLLCGSPHPLLSGEMPEDVYEWYRYLQEIDSEYTEFTIEELYQIAEVAVMKSRHSLFVEGNYNPAP